MAAGFVSILEVCVEFCTGRGGSDTPMLFDDVPLLEGVERLYGAPNRLPPFKRELLVRYPLVD